MREALKKYRILICLELILLVILLPGCFKTEESVYLDGNVCLNVSEGNFVYSGDFFSVIPGVYQVRVNGVKQDNGTVFVTAYSEQHAWRTFRCNGANIYAQQETLDFEIYVLEKLDNVFVNFQATEGNAYIDNVEVVRLNWGNRIILFYLIVVSMLLNMLLIFRDRILSCKISKEKQIVFWGLAASILVAYFPYMTDYFWSSAADIPFQWLRIEGLRDTILCQNQFPVYVQSNWLYGHGYAVSVFYGDLLLWIPVAFRLIGFSLMSSYKMFVLVVTIMTAMITYYSFYKCTKHCYAALFGSVLYMLAPYRIYNFYNRGAVGEYLAMTFFPLIICGMYRLYTEDVNNATYKTEKWSIIIGLSVILQSHIPSCELSILFILFTAIVFIKRSFRKQTILELLKAATICMFINASFWVPLLQMMFGDKYELSNIVSKNIQHMGTWFAEIFQLFPNKSAYQTGMHNAESFQLDVASLIMFCVVMIALAGKCFVRKSDVSINRYGKIVFFWQCMVFLTWFMSTRYFPWDFIASIPFISIFATALQFPTRMFALVSVFSAIGSAFFFLWYEEECANLIGNKQSVNQIKKGCIAALIILAFFSAVYHVNDITYQYMPTWLYNGENLESISVVNGEYMLEDTKISEYRHHYPVADIGLTWSDYQKKGTTVLINVVNSSQEERYLEIPLTGYIGYEVRSVSEKDLLEQPRIAEERGQHGDLRIAVPADYEGTIEVSYKGLKSFRIAELISLLTLLVIILDRLFRRKKWKTKICN